MRYGQLPADLGFIDVQIPEVMYYLYLPVKLAGEWTGFFLPDNLRPLRDLLNEVGSDLGADRYRDNNIYLTVKRMFVGGGITPNRPGWHADGFGTEDLNYIWYDSVPTVFNTSKFSITEGDHHASLKEFDAQAIPQNDVVFPVRHLLRLDPSVVHRVADTPQDQVMRTFVKVSVSKERYNLKDNSINHIMRRVTGGTSDWVYYDRSEVRNCPTTAQKDSYPGYCPDK